MRHAASIRAPKRLAFLAVGTIAGFAIAMWSPNLAMPLVAVTVAVRALGST